MFVGIRHGQEGQPKSTSRRKNKQNPLIPPREKIDQNKSWSPWSQWACPYLVGMESLKVPKISGISGKLRTLERSKEK